MTSHPKTIERGQNETPTAVVATLVDISGDSIIYCAVVKLANALHLLEARTIGIKSTIVAAIDILDAKRRTSARDRWTDS